MATSIVSISPPSSPYNRPSPVNSNIDCSPPLDDHTILQLQVNDLKRKLYVDGYDEDAIRKVMLRRRTLKSRIYTRKCRAKCRSSVNELRKERDNLQNEKARILWEIYIYKAHIHQATYSC